MECVPYWFVFLFLPILLLCIKYFILCDIQSTWIVLNGLFSRLCHKVCAYPNMGPWRKHLRVGFFFHHNIFYVLHRRTWPDLVLKWKKFISCKQHSCIFIKNFIMLSSWIWNFANFSTINFYEDISSCNGWKLLIIHMLSLKFVSNLRFEHMSVTVFLGKVLREPFIIGLKALVTLLLLCWNYFNYNAFKRGGSWRFIPHLVTKSTNKIYWTLMKLVIRNHLIYIRMLLELELF